MKVEIFFKIQVTRPAGVPGTALLAVSALGLANVGNWAH